MSGIMYEMFPKDFQERRHLAVTLTGRISTQLSIHNWSLRMLSDKSGVPYETIKKVANGKISNPSLNSVLKIASAFGCTVDYLAGKSDNSSTF